jgi:predicted RNA-binding protein with PIN domain
MAIVRILVDGFSLLHNWPQLAPGKPRHSAAAREELIRLLTRYADACGTPVTVIFDGAGARPGTPSPPAAGALEVLYSRGGQTADDIIERVTHRMKPHGEVLVVTDDWAERETVLALGGMASSCVNFMAAVKAAMKELDHDLKLYNLRERNRFKR